MLASVRSLPFAQALKRMFHQIEKRNMTFKIFDLAGCKRTPVLPDGHKACTPIREGRRNRVVSREGCEEGEAGTENANGNVNEEEKARWCAPSQLARFSAMEKAGSIGVNRGKSR
jgi:hypothetical protein